jgi:hypothetical protein
MKHQIASTSPVSISSRVHRLLTVLALLFALSLGVLPAALADNLLTGLQSTFESPSVPDGWSAFGGTLSTTSAVKHGGSYSGKLAGRTQSWYSPQYNIYNILKADGPGTYFISIWVYVDDLATSPSNGRMVIRGASVGQYSFFGPGLSYGVISGYFPTFVGTWKQYTGAVTVTAGDLANATGDMNLMIDSLPGTAIQNVYFDDVSITYRPTVEHWRAQEFSFSSMPVLGSATTTFEGPAVPTGWTAFGGGTVSTTTAIQQDGAYSLKLAGRTQSWYSPQYNIYSGLKNNGPGTYNVSVWVYVDNLAVSPSNGRLLIRGTSVGQYSFFTAGQSYGPISTNFSTAVGTWRQYTGAVTVTAADLTNPTGDMNLMIDSLPGTATQNLYFDQVQINKTYADPFDEVTMDVTFIGPGGATLTMPAFWDGGSTWKVRFAPLLTGLWTYNTSCSNPLDTGLQNQVGALNCTPYTGNLTIYQRGFLRALPGWRFLFYDDTTPFFYIGDTHWSMPAEPYGTMFQPLVDQRKSQGFTVYQSEPIGAAYVLWDGVDASDLPIFTDLDNRFKYIADAGLVHANSQLFFTSTFTFNSYPTALIEKLARYWVARYAAYPVLWTTAQEADDDFYAAYTPATNPWKTVFEYIHQYDPYEHPLTAHQEHTGDTRASDSAFKDLPGHNWFASQWTPAKNALIDFNVPKDYWNNGGIKPTVMYESFYENLWTSEFGARHSAWCAYLNGMFGHGYGAQDIWLYNSDYDEQSDTTAFGITITVAMKQVLWTTSRNFATGTQLGTHLKNFFTSLNWWQLTPRFDDAAYFVRNQSYYSIATINNDTYVVYLHNGSNKKTGTLKGMDNGVAYTAKWFNPRTGAYTTISTNIVPTSGQWTIPQRPDTSDWVLYVYHP